MLELTKEKLECLLEMERFFAPILARIKAQAQRALRPYYKLEDIDRVHITPDGVQIDYEYNDACNCHPEYCHSHKEVGWDILDLDDEGIYTYLADQLKMEKDYKENQTKIREEIERKKYAEKEEKRERELFDNLKKKYEQLSKKFEPQQ